VFITENGQLGVLQSSERYKTGIQTMDADASKLQQLRQVTFHLKTEPNGIRQYGLIAEEVDKVFPDLVIRDEAGLIQGVRYDELAPILLKQVQEQQKSLSAEDDKIAAQGRELTAQAQQLREIKQQFADMAAVNRQMQDALAALQAKTQQVAMR
jgi:flagellar capping protein FliD